MTLPRPPSTDAGRAYPRSAGADRTLTAETNMTTYRIIGTCQKSAVDPTRETVGLTSAGYVCVDGHDGRPPHLTEYRESDLPASFGGLGMDWRPGPLTAPQYCAARRVGAAIAGDVLADSDMPREWSDDHLSGDDGAILAAAGIEPDTDEWIAAASVAKREYLRRIAPNRKGDR